MKNSNSNGGSMTGGQKCFLGVVGLLVLDGIVTNILKLKNNKNVIQACSTDEEKKEVFEKDDED